MNLSLGASMFGRGVLSLLARALAILLAVSALLPYAGGPLIGDDLTLVASAVHAHSLGMTLPEYALDLVVLSTSDNHVLPVGGLVTAVITWPLAAVGSFGLSLPWLWSVLRVVLIVMTLYVATWAATEWVSPVDDAERKRGMRWTLFLFTAATAGAFVQVHGHWSQDPVLAYGPSAWISAILVFAFLGCARVVMKGPSLRTELTWSAVSLVIGIVGLLFYEMTVIGPVTLSIAIPLLLLAKIDGVTRRGISLAASIAAVLVTAFAVIQYVRLLEPGVYQGSTPGYGAMILPVWIAGMAGNLPLANLPLTVQLSLVPDLNVFEALWVVSSVLTLWMFALLVRRGNKVELRLKSALLFVAILLTLMALATALYAATGKYQMELGTQIGRTYLFYAFGLIGIPLSVSLVAYSIGASTRGRVLVLVFLGAGLSLTAVVQYAVNSASLAAISRDWAWTNQYVEGLLEGGHTPNLCTLRSKLENSAIPEEYQSQILEQTTNILTVQGRNSPCFAAQAN